MAFAPPVIIDSPPRLPIPFGLFSHVTLPTPSDPHWQNGISFEPQPCSNDVIATGAPYCDPETGVPIDPGFPLDFSGTGVGRELPEFGPFNIWAPYSCSPMGRSTDYARDRATASLLAGEERAVEHALWTGELQNRRFTEDVETLGTALKPVAALALLEQWFATEHGAQGMIHVSLAAGVGLIKDGLIKASGSTVRTALGTPVIVGAGYPGTGPDGTPAAEGTAWAYGTPPLFGRRSEVFTTDLLFDQRQNDAYLLAGRTYAIGWDSCSTPENAAVNFTL